MFRCITELKGIAVDIDSFENFETGDWVEINNVVPCVFLTEENERRKVLEAGVTSGKVIKLKQFEKNLAPNKTTHIKVLETLGIKNTELAYLSCSHSFLEQANSFLSGTIWITENVSYEQASRAPDLILNSIENLKKALKEKVVGFFGEMCIFPASLSQATMCPVDYEIEDEKVPMYVLGRYFGRSHYMNNLHPYSTVIRLNKKQDKPYTGVFDIALKQVYEVAVQALKEIHKIDCICAVPVKPEKTTRFDDILEGLANDCGIANVGKNFICIRDYPDQKATSSAAERENNVKDAFSYQGNLSGSTVALIDDIASSGATIRECTRELKKQGAAEVIIILLAINQFKTGAYWSSETPQVSCQKCGAEMALQISKNRKLFFNCLDCYSNQVQSSPINFDKGWEQLCNDENMKF